MCKQEVLISKFPQSNVERENLFGLYYFSKMTGWVGSENGLFDDVHYCIYADIVGGWVRKSLKIGTYYDCTYSDLT